MAHIEKKKNVQHNTVMPETGNLRDIRNAWARTPRNLLYDTGGVHPRVPMKCRCGKRAKEAFLVISEAPYNG